MVEALSRKTIGGIHDALSENVSCLIGYCDENYEKDSIAVCVGLLKEIILSDTEPTIADNPSNQLLRRNRLQEILHNIWVLLNPNFESYQKLLIINAKRSDAMTIDQFNELLPGLREKAYQMLPHVIFRSEELSAYADEFKQLISIHIKITLRCPNRFFNQ